MRYRITTNGMRFSVESEKTARWWCFGWRISKRWYRRWPDWPYSRGDDTKLDDAQRALKRVMAEDSIPTVVECACSKPLTKPGVESDDEWLERMKQEVAGLAVHGTDSIEE